MAKVEWKDVVLAESDDTIKVEGNLYFPPDAVNSQYFHASENHTTCPWKGVASYYHIQVDGETNTDAAWYYPQASDAAKNFEGYIAFYGNRVRITA